MTIRKENNYDKRGRIFRKLPSKYTYAANLTTSPVYCPYFGRNGITLPALTADTDASNPQLVLLQHTVAYWKRKKNASKMTADSTGASPKIVYGTSSEVSTAVTTAKAALS